MSGRGASSRVRRRRLVVAVLAVASAVVVGLYAGLSGPSPAHHRRGAAASRPRPSSPPPPAAVEAGLLPWRLAAPISRSVVLPGSGSSLVVLGGLTDGATTTGAVTSLDTSTGAAASTAVLAAPVHDAAGAVVDGRDVVFGGGAQSTVGTVQSWSPTGAPSVAGALPQPRSDGAVATIGPTAYVVGGYDGSTADTAVLATRDGRAFAVVAHLPVAVRYGAVSALGDRLYVFGGQAVGGPSNGQALRTIQEVDPAGHRASVVGQLPEAVSGAAAVTLAGEVYVLGGDSPGAQAPLPGVGSTQLGAAAGGANPGAGKRGAITDSARRGGAPTGPRLLAAAAGAPTTSSTVWAFDPRTRRVLVAGHLQVPVSHAGVAVVGSTAWVVGGESDGTQVDTVQMVTPNRAFGTAGAPGAGSPYFGDQLLVADRGNNRLLLLNAAMDVTWTYPSTTTPIDPLGFYFPDDAFFVHHGTAIISNQEQNETIVEIGFPSGKVVWSYGHPRHPGTAAGYLHEPDDAYVLQNGQITVADAQNCRVLVIDPDGTVAQQIGTDGVCVHHPPSSIGSPNGDTPLANGDLLVSEINGSWVSEFTTAGKLVWTRQLPISYPSDPQQIGPDRYLIADYSHPGQILEFDREGHILYRYDVAAGPGMLDHPSLAELLPSGVIMANDDYRNRMVAIDPRTQALVWQYGVNDQAGTSPGMLDTPDGFDLLAPGGSTPTHSATG